MTALLSHLSYAEHNARLDALRKVLACPADGCFARSPWTNATAATIAGWSFEDHVVDGQMMWFWHCPDHRVADPLAPLPSKQVIRTVTDGGLSLKQIRALPFPDVRLVLVRLGENVGTQVAAVLSATHEQWRVIGWRAWSSRWTTPKFVEQSKLIGPPLPDDRRLKDMAKHWPP